jgi:hypothetical protein
MIVNAYAVLDIFTSLARLLLGLLVIGLAFSTWWQRRGDLAAEQKTRIEDRFYLLVLLGLFLVVLNITSWPLLYLLLQSYVPQWPGVMCIYGVTQVGKGSLGTSRFLPVLLTALQLLKPALVFLTGAWFVLYSINRRTMTAPLMPALLVFTILLGVVAVADSTAESAYLVIPKKEEFLSAGCCSGAIESDSQAARFVPGLALDEETRPWLYAAYYVVNLGMCAAITLYIRRPEWGKSGIGLLPLVSGALVSVPVNWVFLVEIAAPTLLHLPHHHCPYDLIPVVPESLAAIALFVLGCFATGWACVAAFADRPQTRPFLGDEVAKLLRLALWGYCFSLAMLSFEMALA